MGEWVGLRSLPNSAARSACAQTKSCRRASRRMQHRVGGCHTDLLSACASPVDSATSPMRAAAAGRKHGRGDGDGDGVRQAAAGAGVGGGSLVSSLSGQGSRHGGGQHSRGRGGGTSKGVDVVLGPAVPCADETSIFRALGLAYVPNTMRRWDF